MSRMISEVTSLVVVWCSARWPPAAIPTGFTEHFSDNYYHFTHNRH